MSIRLMSIAWKAHGLNPGQKLVLIALCDNASDEGICYPSIKTLAKKCSMGERTVSRHLADFEVLLLITREERPGRSTFYTINPRHFGTTPADAEPANLAPPPAKLAPTPNNEEPSLNLLPKEPIGLVKTKRSRKQMVSLQTWLDDLKAKGEKAIPETDPIFTYAEKAGIPADFLLLAWEEFKAKHVGAAGKEQKDWRAHFRDAVRRNWFRLWWIDPKAGYTLTTSGLQAQKVHEAKEAA